MCLSKPSIDTSAIAQAQQEAIKEQLNRSNSLLSNERTAETTGEKTSNKRTMNSLRVPLKGKYDTGSTGVNTTDTTTGLNIPI